MTAKHFLTEFTIYFCLMFVVNLVVTYIWSLVFNGVGSIDWLRSIVFPIVWAVVISMANTTIINKSKKYIIDAFELQGFADKSR